MPFMISGRNEERSNQGMRMKTNLLEVVPKRRSTLWLTLATLIFISAFGTHIVGQTASPIESAETRTMRVIALRLRPGQDLAPTTWRRSSKRNQSAPALSSPRWAACDTWRSGWLTNLQPRNSSKFEIVSLDEDRQSKTRDANNRTR